MKFRHTLYSIGISLLVINSSHAFANTIWNKQLQDRLTLSPEWQYLHNQVDISGAELNAAQQPLYNPELEFSYEDKSERAYQATLSQTVDIFNKRDTRAQLALLQQRIAKLEQQQGESQIIANAMILLLETRRAKALQTLANEQLQITQRLIDLTKKQLDAGEATQIDLDLVKLSLSEALETKANAQQNLHNYQAEQTILLGDLITELPQPLSYSESEAPDFYQMSKTSLQVQIQNLRTQQAQLHIQNAIKESKSEPTLGLGMGQDGDDSVFALSISFPLNVRNSYNAEIDVAKASAKSSDLALAQAKLSTKQALKRSWNRRVQHQELQKAWLKPSQNSLTTLNRKLEKLWRLGELTTTNYLQNIQQLNQALAADININTEADISLIDWLNTSNQLQDWLDQQ